MLLIAFSTTVRFIDMLGFSKNITAYPFFSLRFFLSTIFFHSNISVIDRTISCADSISNMLCWSIPKSLDTLLRYSYYDYNTKSVFIPKTKNICVHFKVYIFIFKCTTFLFEDTTKTKLVPESLLRVLKNRRCPKVEKQSSSCKKKYMFSMLCFGRIKIWS